MLEVAMPGQIVSYSYKQQGVEEPYGVIFLLQHGNIENGEMQDCDFAKVIVNDQELNKYFQGLNLSDRYYDAILKVKVVQNPKKTEIMWFLVDVPAIKAARYFYDLQSLQTVWVKFNNRIKLVDGAGI